MRTFYPRPASKDLETELALIQNVMAAPIFIYIDLLFLSLLLTFILFPLHQSYMIAGAIFLLFSGICIAFYLLLSKWLRE